jgi:hypothetical protein
VLVLVCVVLVPVLAASAPAETPVCTLTAATPAAMIVVNAPYASVPLIVPV